MLQPIYPSTNFSIFNVYPDQYSKLGFTEVPDKVIVRQTMEEASHFDPKQISMNIFQEDDMIQFHIPLGLEFILKSQNESLAVKFTNEGLVAVTEDAPEKKVHHTQTLIGRLVPPRLDFANGRLHPEVLKYISVHSSSEDDYKNKVSKWLTCTHERLEDEELGKICDERKDQKRICVNIDDL